MTRARSPREDPPAAFSAQHLGSKQCLCLCLCRCYKRYPRVPGHIAAGPTEWPPKPLSFCATHPKSNTARTARSRPNRHCLRRKGSCLPLASFQSYPHFIQTHQSDSSRVYKQLQNVATSTTDAQHQVVMRFVPVGLLFVPIIWAIFKWFECMGSLGSSLATVK